MLPSCHQLEARRMLRPLRPPSTAEWLVAPTALTISKMRVRTGPREARNR